jgi:hypothetical protein
VRTTARDLLLDQVLIPECLKTDRAKKGLMRRPRWRLSDNHICQRALTATRYDGSSGAPGLDGYSSPDGAED